jgi:hypothetical protein
MPARCRVELRPHRRQQQPESIIDSPLRLRVELVVTRTSEASDEICGACYLALQNIGSAWIRPFSREVAMTVESWQVAKLFRAIGVLCAIVLVIVIADAQRIFADDAQQQGNNAQGQDNTAGLAQIGLNVAPVQLNMAGKDPNLVGLGSYIVNVLADCNGCHSAGPQTEYLPGHNPYFRDQTAAINPATYLGGGRDFGKVGPPSTPDIISRNLTPDKSGRPEGGRTFDEFRQIIRTGVDLDKLHPNCSLFVTTNCFPPPTDGSLLQIMPWPGLSHMTDHELLAIYTYLSAIPCLSQGNPGSELYNDCGP